MAFTTTGERQQGSDTYIRKPGAALNLKRIRSARCISGTPLMDGWSPDPMGLVVVFDNEAADKGGWEDSIYLGGSMEFGIDPETNTEVVTGFRGAFPVRDLFNGLGIKIDVEDGQTTFNGDPFAIAVIPDAALQQLVGKEIVTLSYDLRPRDDGKGTVKRAFRRVVVPGEIEQGESFKDAADRLYQMFLDQHEAGYVKGWMGPGKGSAASSGDGASAETTAPTGNPFKQQATSTDSFAPDDDLPF
ncbi:MAG: hypothetical protein AAGF99_00300 [Bacteroidota bacterium]